jgi:competence protein ComEC
MYRSEFFYYIIGGFVLGIFSRSFFEMSSYATVFLMSISFFIWFFLFLTRGDEDNLSHALFLIFLVCCVGFSFGFGILRYNLSELYTTDSHLESRIDKKVELEGVIIDEPQEKAETVSLIVKFEKLLNNDKAIDISSRGIITVDLYPKFYYGDRVKLQGILQKPKNFKSNSGSEFDYVSYLAKDGVYYQMYRPKIIFESSHNGNFVKEKLFSLKNIFMRKIQSVIPEPESSLLGGLLLGAKQSLGKDIEENFRKAGIIHIVVLSGYNITIVAEFIMNVLSFLPKFFALSFGITGIILFALMTGASATTIRASLMVLLVLLSKNLGRTYDVTRALFLAGFIMLFLNPKILVFDPSFELSFMAMFGLIYLSPVVEKYLLFLPDKFQIRQFAVATVTTQIFLLPFLLYKTGMLSIVALPVNMLILAFIPLTMLVGFLSGVAAFISYYASLPFAFGAHLLLGYELRVVDMFANMPFSALTIKDFPVWLLILMYVFYGFFLYTFYAKQKPPPRAGAP